MQEFDRKEQERISALPEMDRYLIDSRDHVLRSFDGRPVMKESTIPVMIALMIIGCVICAVIAFLRTGTQRVLMLGAAVFFAFYAFRYFQYLSVIRRP